ncbi:RluA family pseudouridine synthase [Fusibacter sp. 3D3]|uniref:RluA family pseudouridine synthase n=1 Tax=Fusibacter sp. 3D3 TaxID=1048380 RepID=UPI0008536C79|nr:RluA family pseudouridine synthase [Fusibacter sp. 3D3]GAU79469.1 ribosomal large subunit pseudouridine synthase C [Fusibacter sp. 3D3]
MKTIIITKNEADQRLDRFLLKYFNNTTRTNVYKLIRKKMFKVNGIRVKEDYFLKDEDKLDIFLQDETIEGLMKEIVTVKPDQIGLDILFENDDMLIVNKPKGMLTHPDKDEYKNTLATIVHYYLADLCTKTFRPAPVHRLDKNTSGLILFAKTYESLKLYNALMRERKIGKYYLTVVEGTLKGPGEVKGYLIKDEVKNKVTILKSNQDESKFCHTKYSVLKRYRAYTLVEIELLTGRSHQIRASMASIGHPIVGDVKYGGKKVDDISTQLLHGYKLIIDGKVYQTQSKEIEAFVQKL